MVVVVAWVAGVRGVRCEVTGEGMEGVSGLCWGEVAYGYPVNPSSSRVIKVIGAGGSLRCLARSAGTVPPHRGPGAASSPPQRDTLSSASP